jgi:hypothetical protein
MSVALRSFFVRALFGAVLVAAAAPPSLAEEKLARGSAAAARASIVVPDLERHLQTLAADALEGREAGSRGGQAAGAYLQDELKKFNLRPAGDEGTWFQEFGPVYRNVLALVPGSDPSLAQQVLLLCGHYDHVGYGNASNSNGPIGQIHNGADDNASGTAVLLELAQAFGQLEPAVRRPILFAFWDAEEKGLLGSKHWTAQPTVPLEQIRFVINLDMVGRIKQDKVEMFGARSAVGLRQLASRHNAALDFRFTWEVPENSDHWPFYSRRIPFLMPFSGYHNEYHRPTDDVDLINFPGTEAVARWIFDVTRELADAESLPPFRPESFRETVAQQRVEERAAPPGRTRFGVQWANDDPGPGLRVTRVVAGTPAARAGLVPGDRLLEFGDAPLAPSTALHDLIRKSASPVQVKVLRTTGAAETLDVALDGKPGRIGIRWRVDPAEPGVVILSRVDSSSPAERAGLQVNDRVLRVNGETFADGEQFRQLAAASPPTIRLEIERNGRLTTIEFDLP